MRATRTILAVLLLVSMLLGVSALQPGMLPPFTIDFTEIEVEEFADEVNFEKELLVYERHDQG